MDCYVFHTLTEVYIRSARAHQIGPEYIVHSSNLHSYIINAGKFVNPKYIYIFVYKNRPSFLYMCVTSRKRQVLKVWDNWIERKRILKEMITRSVYIISSKRKPILSRSIYLDVHYWYREGNNPWRRVRRKFSCSYRVENIFERREQKRFFLKRKLKCVEKNDRYTWAAKMHLGLNTKACVPRTKCT